MVMQAKGLQRCWLIGEIKCKRFIGAYNLSTGPNFHILNSREAELLTTASDTRRRYSPPPS